MPGLFAGLGLGGAAVPESRPDAAKVGSFDFMQRSAPQENQTSIPAKDSEGTAQPSPQLAQGPSDGAGLGLFAGLVSQPPPKREPQPMSAMSAFGFMGGAPTSSPAGDREGQTAQPGRYDNIT